MRAVEIEQPKKRNRTLQREQKEHDLKKKKKSPTEDLQRNNRSESKARTRAFEEGNPNEQGKKRENEGFVRIFFWL